MEIDACVALSLIMFRTPGSIPKCLEPTCTLIGCHTYLHYVGHFPSLNWLTDHFLQILRGLLAGNRNQKLHQIDARTVTKNNSRQTNSFLEVTLQQSLTKPDKDEYDLYDVRDTKQHNWKQL